MTKKSDFIKIFLITVISFLIIDFLIGKNLYKNFIRKSFVDADIGMGLPDNVYHHKFKKNYKTKNAKWGSEIYKFCTDDNGFRTFCSNKVKIRRDFDIGLIGDSFTEGIGLNYDDTFSGIIEKKLKNKTVANLGVTSYSPAIYYKKIKKLLEENYNFKEIIVFLDISDLYDDNVCYQLKLEKVILREPPNGKDTCHYINYDTKEKILAFMNQKLKLSYELIKIVSDALIKLEIKNQTIKHSVINSQKSEWTFNYNKKNYNNLEREEFINTSIENMTMLAEILQKKKIKLSIVLYPWPGTLKYDKRNNIHVKIWKNFCNIHCYKFYNLMDPFYDLLEEKDFIKIYQEYYINNDVHFNKNGNKFIADNFLKNFKQ